MYNDTDNAQQQKAKRIIRAALGQGLSVTVADGEGGYSLFRARDYAAIVDAIGEMDMDELIFSRADGSHAGWMMLVWEAGGTAEELPADYTANDTMDTLARA